jgi:hypothetical protein
MQLLGFSFKIHSLFIKHIPIYYTLNLLLLLKYPLVVFFVIKIPISCFLLLKYPLVVFFVIKIPISAGFDPHTNRNTITDYILIETQ